jgi:hypothetical protein
MLHRVDVQSRVLPVKFKTEPTKEDVGEVNYIFLKRYRIDVRHTFGSEFDLILAFYTIGRGLFAHRPMNHG